MWLVLIGILASFANAACPTEPELRDDDGSVVALEQNLKFITTGGYREERAALLAGWLGGSGRHVDILLLSEARLTERLTAALPGWCLYTQDTPPGASHYRWRPIEDHRPPGGLALGVRQRTEGIEREIAVEAGRRFRAHPTTLVEGFIARLANYHKGWAEVTVDGSHIVWTHAQASYGGHPDRGAGGPGRGRAGQFDDLAEDLGRPDGPTLLTGDLNLLDRFRVGEGGRAHAAVVDSETLARFEERTGIEFHWSRPALRTGDQGSFYGALERTDATPRWDQGARYDRVGVNTPFLGRHPGTRIRHVEIELGTLRLSDHDGLEITIPYGGPASTR
jgi:hypothetical protein